MRSMTCHRQRGYTAADLRAGLIIGAFFGGGLFLQIIGLQYTLPSVSAFLTSLPVIMAPLAQAWFFRRPVGGLLWVSVFLATLGIVILSRATDSATASNTLAQRPPLYLAGEILTIASAVFFTSQILAVDRLGPRADVIRMTTIVLIVGALVNGVGGALLAGDMIYQRPVLGAILGQHTLWWAMPTLVLFSSVLALHLMNVYQPRVSPATASVVYCLEPVMATAFSVCFRTEVLTGTSIIGGLVVLASVLMASGIFDFRFWIFDGH